MGEPVDQMHQAQVNLFAALNVNNHSFYDLNNNKMYTK